ncbi:MAG TPA: deaminase [Thermoanaerobaculia bacterium]
MTPDEIAFMRMAIDEARKTKFEADRESRPYVGAVAVRDGEVLGTAYRGELALGEHAEFTLLEKKLKNAQLAGATIYTTLEPCTQRNAPKVPCADRIVERKVARVVIGTLDPNPLISGRGQRRLRDANIATDLFPADLMAELEELNREFTRFQKRQIDGQHATEEFIHANKNRSLDAWYRVVNSVYWNRNFHLTPAAIFAHLVEVVGGISSLASTKRKQGIDPEAHVAKAVAWWLALCGKLGVKSPEDLLWDKFPRICPYCQEAQHDPIECGAKKRATPGPPWELLTKLSSGKSRPKRLGDWQLMFQEIYPARSAAEYGEAFARLSEELGELAEAVRVFPAEPGYFLSEAADVFAWLMKVKNIIELEKMVPKKQYGRALEITFCRSYPDSCFECGKKMCACPPILPSTIGRIAHEVPVGRGGFSDEGRFMTPNTASEFFRPDAA